MKRGLKSMLQPALVVVESGSGRTDPAFFSICQFPVPMPFANFFIQGTPVVSDKLPFVIDECCSTIQWTNNDAVNDFSSLKNCVVNILIIVFLPFWICNN